VLYNKKQSACNALRSPVSLGKRFESIPCTQELHISGTRTSSCFGTIDLKFGSVFLPSVVHGLAPVIADVKSRNVGLCCRCWTAWREATSCCFARPRCFGHSEIFHSTFKNENFCTDLCIWNLWKWLQPRVFLKCRLWRFSKFHGVEWQQQLEQIYYTIRSQALQWNTVSARLLLKENTEEEGFWCLASNYRTLNWVTPVGSASRQECFDWSAKPTLMAPHEDVKTSLPQTGKVAFD